MRWTTLILTVVLVLGSSLTALGKGLTFDPAVRLVIQEAERLEEVLRADGVTSRKEVHDLRALRRSKVTLENALHEHAEGRIFHASRFLRRGIDKVKRVFRRNGPARGDRGHAGAEATELALDKTLEFVVSDVAALRARVEALPDGAEKRNMSGWLTTITEVSPLVGYSALGRARRKLAWLERRAAAQANNPASGIPGNLPRGNYAVAISANGSNAVEQGVIRNTGGAPLRNALRKLVQTLMKGHQRQGCTTTATSTPFNGTRFTLGASIQCPKGNGTVTTVLTFLVTRIK